MYQELLYAAARCCSWIFLTAEVMVLSRSAAYTEIQTKGSRHLTWILLQEIWK